MRNLLPCCRSGHESNKENSSDADGMFHGHGENVLHEKGVEFYCLPENHKLGDGDEAHPTENEQ